MFVIFSSIKFEMWQRSKSLTKSQRKVIDFPQIPNMGCIKCLTPEGTPQNYSVSQVFKYCKSVRDSCSKLLGTLLSPSVKVKNPRMVLEGLQKGDLW